MIHIYYIYRFPNSIAANNTPSWIQIQPFLEGYVKKPQSYTKNTRHVSFIGTSLLTFFSSNVPTSSLIHFKGPLNLYKKQSNYNTNSTVG